MPPEHQEAIIKALIRHIINLPPEELLELVERLGIGRRICD